MVIYIFHKIFSQKGSILYELENQITIIGIYNYHGVLLFIAGFIYKKSNNLLCYNFHKVNIPVS